MDKKTLLLHGNNSVLERLKSNPASIKKIFLQDSYNAPQIEKLIKDKKIPLERLSLKQLSRIKRAPNLQGIIARVEGFRYFSFDDLLSYPKDKKLTLIFLDRIYDPQNLGAIIRTAACFGGFAIIIPKHKACGITETVLHVAQGGENYVPISMVTNISSAVREAKDSGYWIMGAVTDSDAKDLDQVSLPFPLGLVLGSEGEGVRYGVEKHLDIKARIPMRGAPLSFNVTMACAILCYQIARSRDV